MESVITTCSKCGCRFQWIMGISSGQPNCPKCGYNPLRKFQDPDIKNLIHLLNSADFCDSRNAARELGKRGDRRAVMPLIDAIYKQPPNEGAIHALGDLGDERAVEPLISLLVNTNYYSGTIADSLLAIGSTRAIQSVANSIEKIHPDSIHGVLRELGKKWENAIPFLVSMTKHRFDYIRRGATNVLKELGWEPSDEEEKILFFINSGQWKNLQPLAPKVRDRLVDALVKSDNDIPKESAFKILTALDWTPITIQEAIAYLKAGGKAEVLAKTEASLVDPLILELTEERSGIRETAAKALCIIGDLRGLQRVIESDISFSITEDAIRSLIKSSDDRWMMILNQALRDSKYKLDIVRILGKIGGSNAMKALDYALGNENYEVRKIAVDSISGSGDSQMLYAIMAALNDAHWWVRWAAVTALGKTGDPKALKALIEMLNDKSENVVSAVCEALANINDTQSVKALVGLLQNPSVRQDAAKALGKLKAHEAVEPLLLMTRNKKVDRSTRDIAVNAIKEITGKRPKLYCLVATVCFGTQNSHEVRILRDFRDQWLMNYRLGRCFVSLYYNISPAIAEIILRNRLLQMLVRDVFPRPLVFAVSLIYIKRDGQ